MSTTRSQLQRYNLEQMGPGLQEMQFQSRDNTIEFRSIMATVVFRFGMAFYGFALVLFVLCSTVNGQTTASASSTTPKNGSSTATPTPGNHSKPTANVSTTVQPTTHSGNGSTVSPTTGNHSTAVPTTGNNSTAVPTTHGNHSTTVLPTTNGNHSTAKSSTNMNPTPTPAAHSGDHRSDHGKWVATGFAIFFLITTIVMTVLYCRQRKIYRELEGDSSLSRLI